MGDFEVWVAVFVGLAGVARALIWLVGKRRSRNVTKEVSNASQTATTGDESTVIQVQGSENRIRR